MKTLVNMAFFPISSNKGIGFADLMVVIAIGCAAAVFYLPDLIKKEADPALVSKAQSDLQIISEAIRQMEKHSGVLVGYPGPNPCVNDTEFESLEQCRLGLTCNDGKYAPWNGPYLKQIPLDPWGRKYYLDNDFYKNGKVSRVVGSKGPNGVQDYGSNGDDIVFVLCSQGEKGGA